MKLFKVAQYKVVDAFGFSPIGEIRNAIILTKDEDTDLCLIYHPSEGPDFCASFEFAKYNESGLLVPKGGYVNSSSKKLDKLIISLTKGWKQNIIPPKKRKP